MPAHRPVACRSPARRGARRQPLRPGQTAAVALLCWGAVIGVPPARAQAATPPQDAARLPAAFDVLEYEVEGNSTLPEASVERALRPHLGPGRGMAAVEAARDALEQAYQAAGLLTVLVDVPEQRVDGGVVRLRVTEGRVDRVYVTGARWYDQGHIRERLPALREGEVPDFSALQAQVAELNRTPQRQVQPVLKPGWQPGTVDLELKVRDESPLTGTIELHNRHPAHTSASRLVAQMRYANLWQREHVLSASLIVAPSAPRQSRIASLSYAVPAGPDTQWQLTFTSSDSLTEPLGNTVSGQGQTLGLRWLTSRSAANGQHSFSLEAELRDLQQRVRSGTADTGISASELSTPLRYLPFALGWNAQFGAGEGLRATTTQLAATFTFALRPLLRRQVDCAGNIGLQDQFNCNREGADGAFATLRLDSRQQRPMIFGWPGQMAWRLTGQWAGQALVSGEQLVAGGADSVRGHLESEASGDHGLIAGLEWRSPDLAGALRGRPGAPADWLRALALLAYVDAAWLGVHQASAGTASHTHLAGAGIGLRWRLRDQAQADLDLGWPLRDAPQSRRAEARLHARLAWPF